MKQPRAGAADVALVEEDPVDDPLDGLVDRGVLEDDVRRLAAELERQPDLAPGERGLDVAADGGRAGERDLVDPVGAHERGARSTPSPGRIATTPGGQLGLLDDLGEQQRRQRRRLGGLEDRGVAAGERRRELPGRHQQREVPRHDLPDDAHRRDRAAADAVAELVRPARVVEEVRRGERDVDVARLAQRLAAVQRLDDASSRARSWISRAMRNRYFARSRPGSAAHAGCASRAASTAARRSASPAQAICGDRLLGRGVDRRLAARRRAARGTRRR